MPRPRSPRLRSVSISGEDPTIAFGDADWDAFEVAFGRTLNREVREELLGICNWHLSRQWVESLAEPQSAVIDRANDALAKVGKAFEFLVEDLGHHGGDAHGEFSWQLYEFLSEKKFFVPQGTLCKLVERQDGSTEWIPIESEHGIGICPTTDLASAVISHMISALKRIARGDGMRGSGFEGGTAYKGFLLKMRVWAKSHDWPFGPYRGAGEAGEKEPGPLPCLIFELTQRFPNDLRTPVKTSLGVAKRLKAARKEEKNAQSEEAEGDLIA